MSLNSSFLTLLVSVFVFLFGLGMMIRAGRDQVDAKYLGMGFKKVLLYLNDGTRRIGYLRHYDVEQINTDQATKEPFLQLFTSEGKTSLIFKEQLFSLDVLKG